MALVYPQFPRLADVSGTTINAFNNAFSGARDRRLERDAPDRFVEGLEGAGMFGNYLNPQQPMSLSGLGAPVGEVRRAPLPGNDYASSRVAQAHGDVPGPENSYFSAIRAAESGGNDSAKNPRSTATGRYQFTQGTWNGLMQQYPALGLTADGRLDPAQQERAIRVFTRDNARQLSSAGIPVNPGTLYAAHFLGAGGAQQALTQPDNAPMAAVVGRDVVEANPFLANMTVGDFKAWAAQKGGNGNGGYQAPAQAALESLAVGESAPAPVQMADAGGMGFSMPDRETMRSLFANPHTRPMAIELAKANIEYRQNQADPERAANLQYRLAQTEKLRRELSGDLGEAAKVQSSTILDDGTSVLVMNNGQRRVLSPAGEEVTGQSAADAIRAAREYTVQNQQDIYSGRRAGTLGSDIELGGAAAGAKKSGEKTVEAGFSAWEDYGKLQTSIANIDEAISALDAGAKSGIVYNMLPNVTEASASLKNAMDRMGLDVIGSVTFGALSEGEMRLAMETAVPRSLQPAELRNWLQRKRDAQEKAARTLADAAQFLTVPGNTINDWIARNRGRSSASQTGSEPGQRLRFNPETGELE